MGGAHPIGCSSSCAEADEKGRIGRSGSIFWLQSVTVGWMLLEAGVSGYAAWTAQSAAILAFGADSLVEVLSASLVLLKFSPSWEIPERQTARIAGTLLFVLAFVVAGTVAATLLLGLEPKVSPAAMGITLAALIVMPMLAKLKRRAARRTGDVALSADAAQSATCAYLAFVTLLGLGLRAIYGLSWIDSAAALAAIPFLLYEGRSAWRGQVCGC